jgi:hypothetical protein
MAAAAGVFLPPGTAGAGATTVAEQASKPVVLYSAPKAKRARAMTEDDLSDGDEVIVPKMECPANVDKSDFERLKILVGRYRGDRFMHLLPMPPTAYEALGLPKPGVASLMDTALACLNKTSAEEYSTPEVEVRDLRETHTAADFPAFYTGPSHPHMIPEGGIRVIPHNAEAAVSGSAGVGARAGLEMIDE